MERDPVGQSGDVTRAATVPGPRTWIFHLLLVIAAAGVAMAFPWSVGFSGLHNLQGGLWAFITIGFTLTTVSTFRKRRGIRTLGWALMTLGAATVSAEYLLAGSHPIQFTIAALVMFACGFVVINRGKA